MTKSLPSPKELSKLLRYEPDTGLLFWRERTPDMFEGGKYPAERVAHCWNAKYAGQMAFKFKSKSGYLQGSIFDKTYLAHRIVWVVGAGEWPKDQIDHINHDRSDNRWINLRQATSQENHRNRSLSSNNRSGFCGVRFYKQIGKWHTQIRIDGLNKHLGFFDNKTDAITARKAANKKYGYHSNHGG